MIPVNVTHASNRHATFTRKGFTLILYYQGTRYRPIVDVKDKRQNTSTLPFRNCKGRLNTLRAVNVNMGRSMRT